jgi:hypothetical protein
LPATKKTYPPRDCALCGEEFKPNRKDAKRCPACCKGGSKPKRTGKPCACGCGKPAVGDEFATVACCRRSHDLPEPADIHSTDVEDIYTPPPTAAQAEAAARDLQARRRLQRREGPNYFLAIQQAEGQIRGVDSREGRWY